MDQIFWPSKQEEKERYLEHNNDIHDPKYQNFLKPIVDKVLQFQIPEDNGLDFGAGPGPVVHYLLEKQGYPIHLYDPFFYPSKEVLNQTFDYIILTEVVEHFHFPKAEFQKLYDRLKQNGRLYILTHPYEDSISFENWYYKNDQTHTFFYTKRAFEWMKDFYGFRTLDIENRIILFQK